MMVQKEVQEFLVAQTKFNQSLQEILNDLVARVEKLENEEGK